jgi:hypothetical protein
VAEAARVTLPGGALVLDGDTGLWAGPPGLATFVDLANALSRPPQYVWSFADGRFGAAIASRVADALGGRAEWPEPDPGGPFDLVPAEPPPA